jgi:hypothetical protein
MTTHLSFGYASRLDMVQVCFTIIQHSISSNRCSVTLNKGTRIYFSSIIKILFERMSFQPSFIDLTRIPDRPQLLEYSFHGLFNKILRSQVVGRSMWTILNFFKLNDILWRYNTPNVLPYKIGKRRVATCYYKSIHNTMVKG